jgi:hypothetical protein
MREPIIYKKFEDLPINKFNKLVEYNNNKNMEDGEIHLLECVTNLSYDEILELDFNVYVELVSKIEVLDNPSPAEVYSTVTINEKEYTSQLIDGEYIFKTRDILKLKNIIKENPYYYVGDLAALIFVNDETTFEERKALFEEQMTMNYIQYYLIKLQETLNKNGFIK